MYIRTAIAIKANLETFRPYKELQPVHLPAKTRPTLLNVNGGGAMLQVRLARVVHTDNALDLGHHGNGVKEPLTDHVGVDAVGKLNSQTRYHP